MLYKVTPMMPGPESKPKKARDAAQPRKKRKSAVYDHEGHEVLITLMCLKCRSIKPLAQFGLRKMADGAIRNQPWCRGCRSGAGVPKAKPELVEAAPVVAEQVDPVDPVSPVADAVAETPPDEPLNSADLGESAPALIADAAPAGG